MNPRILRSTVTVFAALAAVALPTPSAFTACQFDNPETDVPAAPAAPAQRAPEARKPAPISTLSAEGRARTGLPTTPDAKTDKVSAAVSVPTPAPAPAPVSTKAAQADAPASMDAGAALKLLQDGNARWVANRPTSPNIDAERRKLLADKGQTPVATILACADSRVPIERLFDRGLGDLFVVRVAGNIAGQSELGSIEYGIANLHTPLLVVMGHTRCGAVGAAVSKTEARGNIASLVEQIAPAVDRARRAAPTADKNALIEAAVRENVWQTVFRVFKRSPEVREAALAGRLRVVGAIYDTATGRVEIMGEHPWQSELLDGLAMPERAATAAVGER